MMNRRPMVLAALALLLMGSVLWLGVFPPKTPRILLNQLRAVKSLRQLNTAEQAYFEHNPTIGFACSLSDFHQERLGSTSLGNTVDRVLASGTKASYRFEISCPPNVGKISTYTITGIPTEPGMNGQYAVCTDQSKEIWYSRAGSPSECLVNREPLERKYR